MATTQIRGTWALCGQTPRMHTRARYLFSFAVLAQLAPAQPPAMRLVLPGVVHAAALGDLDGDGVADLAFGDSAAGQLVALSGVDGSFLHRVAGASLPRSAVGNLDGVGGADLVAVTAAVGYSVYSGTTGALLYTVPLASNETSATGVLGRDDLDGDGADDLLVTYALTTGWYAVRARSGRDGTVLWSFDYDAGASIGFSANPLGDVDGDGVEDFWMSRFVGGYSVDEIAEIFSGATRTKIRSYRNTYVTLKPMGDSDADGCDDYLVQESYWWTAPLPRTLVSGKTGALIAGFGTAVDVDSAGDLDGDGIVDVLARNRSGLSVNVHSGLPPFAVLWTYSSPSPLPSIRALGDVDGDGRGDFAFFDSTPDCASISTSGAANLLGAPSVARVGARANQDMALTPGDYGGQAYAVVGSISGTRPGVVIGGVPVPLNPDALTFSPAARGFLLGGSGVLPTEGSANIGLRLPILPASAIGMTVHHVALIFGPLGIEAATVPVPLVILP